jgi:signal transduction histidine kinase/CheY-like chemotaxis protein
MDESRILVLAPLGRDAPLAVRALEEAGMSAQTCADLPDLCARIAEGAGAALVTEEALGSPAVGELISVLGRQPVWSDFPLVVFGSGDTMLARVANVTLLDRPVRIRTLVSTMRSALRARRRQYESRNLLQALEQSVRDRDQFLAMLGHELRNPLAAILTASELLDRTGGGANARERAVLGRQTRTLARLVDDLLEVARVTAGKIVLHRAQVDVRDLVRRAAAGFAAIAQRQQVRLEVAGPQEPLLLLADPLRIEQIVGNLLANAIKYTPAGGHVRIEAARDGEEALIRVADTGIGIPPEMLARVFDLFVQAPGTLERAQGGMGIGLTLVQRLVHLHEGTVQAKSEGTGKGSVFEVRLPIRAGAVTEGNGSARAPSKRSVRVLVVEDNLDARDLLQLALEQMGHSVSVCGDGATAIDCALQQRPQAMIVDLGLPGCDGFEVAREVRSALGDRVRLVALSGYGQPQDRARALEAGFDQFLTKPAEIDALEHALAISN